jgi:large subunit ribosomal protein L1
MASLLLLRRIATSRSSSVAVYPRRYYPPSSSISSPASFSFEEDASSPSRREYVTRAHATPTPTSPIRLALRSILDGAIERHASRLERWEKDKERRVEQRVSYLLRRGGSGMPSPDDVRAMASSSPYRGMDETIELALQLNLDPRKPGQSLRGSMTLPHGNGKTFDVAVFTDDHTLATSALENGAIVAGGSNVIDMIKDGSVSLSSFQRTLATPDMVSQLSSVARILGPRGMMPNAKIGTIVPHDSLLDALASQRSGVSNYRTDKEGIVRLGIGKGSFGIDKLIDNVREVMNEIHGVKPESFGKGRKGQKGKVAKGTKYYLKAHLSATQGKGSVLVDIRTIDPTSAFFMGEPQ